MSVKLPISALLRSLGGAALTTILATTAVKYTTAGKNNSDIDAVHYKTLIKKNYDLLKDLTQDSSKYKRYQEQIIHNASSILSKAPYNEDALFHLAIVEARSGELEKTIELLERARSRDPRNRAILTLLLEVKYASGDLEEALKIVNVLYKLNKNLRGQYIQRIINDYSYPQNRPIITKHIEANPEWASSFLHRYVSQVPLQQVNDILPSIRNYLEENPNNEILSIRYINKLIQLRRFDEAYGYWSSNIAPDQKLKSGIYNSKFTKNDAVPPFNWQLVESKNSYFDFLENEGVYISFKANKRAFVARQILKVPEGNKLVLKLKVDYSYKNENGYFSIQLICKDQKKQLVQYDLKDDFRLDEPIEIPFDNQYPQCKWGQLAIMGNDEIFPKRINIKLAEISVSRAGATQ